jgi:hypothetical protein
MTHRRREVIKERNEKGKTKQKNIWKEKRLKRGKAFIVRNSAVGKALATCT